MRSDDLAPLLGPDPGDSGSVRYRQGKVVTWDSTTGANTIEVRGTVLSNLPILDSSDVALIQPGDVVGVIAVGNGGTAQFFVLGRTVIPGSAGAGAAAAFVNDLLDRRTVAARVDTSGSTTSYNVYVDVSPAGPAVPIVVRSSGRVIVHMSAYITGAETIGSMAVAVSGATTRAAQFNESVTAGDASTGGVALIQVGRTILLEGLNPGLSTFTAKYACMVSTGPTTTFSNRHLVVTAL